MKKIIFCLVVLVPRLAEAAEYTMAVGSRPTCASGSWSVSGTVYTCSGDVTLASGDSIQPASSITVRSRNNFVLNGNNVLGTSSVSVSIESTDGSLEVKGSNNQIFGSITAKNDAKVNGSIVVGNITSSQGNVTVTASTVTGNLKSKNQMQVSSSSTINGNVESTEGDVSISSNSTVWGVCKNKTTNSTASPGTFGNRCMGGAAPPPTPASFNAFETDTGSNAVTGVIKTKVAGTGFTLAIVAVNAGAKMTSFTGQVKAELVANNNAPGTNYSNSTSCPTSGTVVGTSITTGNFTAGRTDTASFAAVAEAYRDVRVRISYPATGTASVQVCSQNSFAIRPAVLTNISAQHANWESAGLTEVLNGVTSSATPVHKAGRPFRLTLSARNAASPAALTSNYSTSSLEVHSLVPIAPASVAGSLAPGSLSGTGTVVSTSATYSDVGAFTARLRDVDFAIIDSGDTPGDCTANGRWVCSDSFSVGRFVPDSLEISAVTFIPTCAAPGKKAFTYSGAPMQLQFTLTARNATGGVTQNYAGAFAKLDLTDTALWSKPSTDPGQMLALGAVNVPPAPGTPVRFGHSRFSAGGLSGAWSAGVAEIKAAVTFSRLTPPLEGTYENFRIGIFPKDSDEVTVSTAALNLDAEPAATSASSPPDRVYLGEAAMRSGRLRLSNAFGSAKMPLTMPVEASYWTGNSWALNSDDSCTTLLSGHFYKSNSSTTVSDATLADGKGGLSLSAPSGSVTGSVDIAANLGATGSGDDQSCLATHGGTPANLPWLRSRNGNCVATYDRDPSARATFGIYSADRRRLIHVRELF